MHALHAAPPVPHEPFDSEPNVSHVPLAVQHPFGHEDALHTHLPPEQASPVAHPVQAAPPVPHEVFDCEPTASHVPEAVQQPFGQDVASQTHCPVVLLHS